MPWAPAPSATSGRDRPEASGRSSDPETATGLPSAVRARAFALIYSVPVAVFGGTTQMVVTWLLKVTGEPMALAWYLMAISLLGLVPMALIRESAPVRTGTPLGWLAA